MRRFRRVLFRIFYRTSFSIVLLVVLAAVALTPADAVYQAWKGRRLVDIGAIAGTYVLTAVLAILIYASRLFTNRSVLSSIPKRYIPIEADDLPGKWTRAEILNGLEKNALIAYNARPRFEPSLESSTSASARISALIGTSTRTNTQYAWAHIAHPGWSSPASRDLPNLHFHTVVKELPDLVEAKAVSLAPLDETDTPDETIVALLERPLNMGLRDYMTHLNQLQLINPDFLAAEFLSLYEHARFSTQPLPEPAFRSLMEIFASILRGMTALDPALYPSSDPLTPSPPSSSSPLPSPSQRPQLAIRAHSNTTKTPAPWTGTTGTARSTSTFSLPLLSSNPSRTHAPPPRRVSEDSVPSVSTSSDPVGEGDSDAASLHTARREGSRESGYSLRPERSRVSVKSEESGGSVVVRRSAGPGDAGVEYTLEIPELERRGG